MSATVSTVYRKESIVSSVNSIANSIVPPWLEEALESPIEEFFEDGGLGRLEEALESPLQELFEDGGLGQLEEALESPLQELLEDLGGVHALGLSASGVAHPAQFAAFNGDGPGCGTHPPGWHPPRVHAAE